MQQGQKRAQHDDLTKIPQMGFSGRVTAGGGVSPPDGGA